MRKALILTMVVVFALMAVPLSSATVIHATINTKTNEGYVNATSNYVLYYNYPSNSSTAQMLNGTVMWMNATSYLNSTGRQFLEQNMNEYQHQNQDRNHHGNDANDANNSINSTANSTGDSNLTTNATTNSTLPTVHVVNATLNYQLHVFANKTNMTIYRNLTIGLKISNITKKVGNNTTVIDMSWRAFRVQGELMSDFRGNLEIKNPFNGLKEQSNVNTNMDVNMLGDMGDFGGDGQGNMFQIGSFFMNDGFGSHVFNYETINFHVFSVPLQQWTRVYNPAANSTTFFYNATSNYSLNESVSVNGLNYSIKLMTDPSAAITTNGQATPTSSNELAVSTAPAPVSTLSITDILVSVGIIVIVAIGLSVVMMRRRTKK
ncbi:MAG: hypothetical protein ACP5UZ_04080 [Thermoplasmata archaeon]